MAATPDAGPISSARKWAITLSVMVVAFMQVLDTSVTNVVLPHLQGSLSAGLEEVSWVITSYLAANAIIIPATGWLAGVLGRKRFFLICCVLFTVSSVLSGMAPNLTFLILYFVALWMILRWDTQRRVDKLLRRFNSGKTDDSLSASAVAG